MRNIYRIDYTLNSTLFEISMCVRGVAMSGHEILFSYKFLYQNISRARKKKGDRVNNNIDRHFQSSLCISQVYAHCSFPMDNSLKLLSFYAISFVFYSLSLFSCVFSLYFLLGFFLSIFINESIEKTHNHQT